MDCGEKFEKEACQVSDKRQNLPSKASHPSTRLARGEIVGACLSN